jgi:hypothetical protein
MFLHIPINNGQTQLSFAILNYVVCRHIDDVSEALNVYVIRAMIEAISTSEKSVNFYQTTRRNIPEDSRLYTCRRENLKLPNNGLFAVK